jgi:uncharacterized membrane protein
MKSQSAPFPRVFFILTLAFHATACMIFGVKLLLINNRSELFANNDLFNYTLYWTIVIVVASWYTCVFGFVKRKKLSNGKTLSITLSVLPLIVGLGVGPVLFYIIRAASLLFKPILPCMTLLLLIISLYYVTKALVYLYFKSKDLLYPAMRKAIMLFSFLSALFLMFASLCVF